MYLIRSLIIGDSNVGKTSLLVRMNENSFTANQSTTIGVDYKAKEIEIDGEAIKLQIWDTAGQERFRSMTAAFYNKAQGVVITFDVNRRESFASLTQWITDVKMNAPYECFALLCANKTDCPEDLWEVSRNEFMEFSAMHEMPLYETSSKTGTNVTKMFVDMARKVMETDRDKLQQIQSPTQQISNIVLNEKNLRQKKRSGCC